MTQPTHPFRNALVVLGALTAACAIPITSLTHGLEFLEVPWMFWFHAACLVATIPLFFKKSLGSQMLTRAFWWQTLLFGALLIASETGLDFAVASYMSAGTAAALVGAGRIGLTEEEDEGSPFHPIAFRTPLMIALILALADTVALFLYAGVGLQRSFTSSPGLFVAGLAMLVGLHGMYRLKLWGVALNLATNLVVAGLILTSVFDIPAPLNAGLVATALIQLALPIPMLGKIIKNIRAGGLKETVEVAEPIEDVVQNVADVADVADVVQDAAQQVSLEVVQESQVAVVEVARG